MCRRDDEGLSADIIRGYIVNKDLQNIPIFCYEETDSTNTRARLMAGELSECAIFVAEGQTAGRGRRGRSFDSEHGAGLYISFLTHPKGSAADAVKITARAAVSLCRAIEKLSTLSPRIKWVNDLIAGGKKLAGILTEGEIGEGGGLSYAVCGMGINLYKREFSPELSEVATSIEELTGENISRGELAALIIEEFLRDADMDEVMADYKRRSSVIGEEVTVYTATESFTARAVDISDSGELIVERADGERISLFSGEVSIKKA